MNATLASASVSQPTSTINILLVEDDAEDALLLSRYLSGRSGVRVSVRHCASLELARAALSGERFHAALLDLDLPDGDGLSLLPILLDRGLPVVVLTGRSDDDVALEAVRRGAQDYIPKDGLTADAMIRCLRHAIERHSLKEQVIVAHAREQAMKDDVLSHVSHELRTPLTAVDQFVGIIRDGHAGPVTAQQQEFLDIVLRNTRQLKRMISDLMDVARVSTGKLLLDTGLVDVCACTADAIDAASSASAEKGIEVVSSLADSGSILGDTSRVTQVIQNVLDNAVKFTPKSGKITVTTRLAGDGFIEIAIEDTGCGISPELQARLFERLQQADAISGGSRRGLGIGLWLAREIVQTMGGSIGVQSEAGRGSRFAITLPLYTLSRLVGDPATGKAHVPLSLLHVSLRPSLRRCGMAIEHARRDLVRFVQRCIVASTDTVLPEAYGTPPNVDVFAIVRVDEEGAGVIRQRLLTEFATGITRLRKLGFVEAVALHRLVGSKEAVDVAEAVAEVRRQICAGIAL